MLKVRLVFYFRTDNWAGSADYYHIEYQKPGRWSTWRRLTEWESPSMARADDAGYKDFLSHKEYAEKIARTLKTVGDLDNYYVEEKRKEAAWREEYDRYLSAQKPIAKEIRIY